MDQPKTPKTEPQSWHDRARASQLPAVDRTGQYSTLGRAAIVATIAKGTR